MFRLDRQHVYRAESLERFLWLQHGFGTRLSNGWPDVSRLVTPKQVHSDHVLLVGDDAPTGADARAGAGDALVSDRRGMMAGVLTADCLPVLLVDARLRAIGAIHAGWRGTMQGISAKAVSVMTCQFGTDPVHIWAAIGPGIGPCCFEVGPEVAGQFNGIFPERADLNQRTRLDLAEANRRQLVAAGVPTSQIEMSGLCTVCGAEEFYSWRRERNTTGRMLSAIGLLTG